ncbi:rRNA pseudouridine synthase [Lysobacter pythonis]|uniref:Pseudouridine synthase n=1 Tax=Solilutibacter pythonis TaxID=2483112 RepID=A0A3M2I3G8_9GAMM|nr:pseudouridine synthase [Lysobacter pythonis]RMH94520.1 rRNA pseudouridine synthase [Lysobacter pythonis]
MSNNNERRRLSLKRDGAEPATAKLEERLHKVLAQAGLGSRRALEQRIADGKVIVNGEPAKVGMSVKAGDKIDMDGRSFIASALTESPRVLMYNKPEGEVTTREDPEGRPTIFDGLPVLKGSRWISIGRLDINTSGLLLLTTDGELANAMMHPSFDVEREYVCRVRAPEGEETVGEKLVEHLRRGVTLEDGPAKFDAIERMSGTDSHDWFRVTLTEGRNREVRRLWESQGCQVSRLKRIRYGNVSLPQPLLRGQSQELTDAQVTALQKSVGLEDSIPAALTLLPVIGQRRAAKSTVHLGGERRSQGGYIGGHNTADEGRELRRFDHVREDRGRRGAPRKTGGLTISGEAAAKQANKTFKPKGPRPQGQRMRPGEQRGDSNPAAMRTWYVPEGVDTGPTGHRNADGRGPKKPWGNKPRGKSAGPNAGGGFRQGEGNRGQPGKPKHPYGHPGNAPSFPSDHATPGFNPYGQAPRQNRGPRPGGPRPPGSRGPKPGGPKPGGGNRGPRGRG